MSDSTDKSPSVQQVMLDELSNVSGFIPFRLKAVMDAINKKLPFRRHSLTSARVMTCWNDLLRGGIVAMSNPDTDRNEYILTELGDATVAHSSRDPINQIGYMAYLDRETAIDSVTRGYVEEALATYRSCCYKATAILIGAAVENLMLNLRDDLLANLKPAPPAKTLEKMNSLSIKIVTEVVAEVILKDLEIDKKRTKDDAKRKLLEDAHARLHPIASEFRQTRNSAGHPASLEPVHPADVHCNLLLFPAKAKLINNLRTWVVEYYV